jgi:hypothetical protein
VTGRGAAIALGVLGLAQMASDVVGLDALRGLAAATAASPAPKVFSAVRGLETYSTRFFVEWREHGGAARSLELTPEVYGRLRGPYNRRNAYGAVLAYGPIFATDPRTRPLFEAVAHYALCGEAPLLRELGVDPEAVRGAVRIRLEPIASSDPGELPLVFEAPCRSEAP